MNTREFNKMNMFTAVNSVFQLSKDSIAKIKKLEEAIGGFGEKLTVISGHDAEYTLAAAGATAAKKSAANTLIDTVMRISNALSVLGDHTGNEQLKAECRIYSSRLYLLRDLELIKLGNHIAEIVQQHAAELAEYGIADSDRAALAAAIESFSKMREGQQQRMSEVKSVRGMLYKDITEAAGILKNEIDPLMELVKAGNSEFYNQYRAARKIKDLGARHASKTEKTQAAEPTITAVSPPVAMKLAA
jgi:hypothetical protein